MKIGLPNALLYYRYGTLWNAFFQRLGCETIISGDTNRRIVLDGVSLSDSECCLPFKIFLGHIAELLNRCDRVLIPRFERTGKDEEFCVRFWGLPDIVRATFPEAQILSYDLRGPRHGGEPLAFLKMGRNLGKSIPNSLAAYHAAKEASLVDGLRSRERQRRDLRSPKIKILVASHPYISHDPAMGGVLAGMLRKLNTVPIFSDRCDHSEAIHHSRALSSDLYWVMNREIIGTVPLLSRQIDGVILITAFPCGTDSLVNELAIRRIQGIPVAHIILDEQQGEAGLQTRIESFVDILEERRRVHGA